MSDIDNTSETDDTIGHHAMGATDDDAQGHVHHKHPATEDDDAQGHVHHKHPATEDDDVQGHKTIQN